MFKNVQIPLRSFYCELKHRPEGDNDGSNEILIETLILQVPRLKSSNMEKQWCLAQLWNRLYEPEYQNRGINQVFIFSAQYGELLARLETKLFDDEPAKKLEVPSQDKFSEWQRQVEKRFKQLYGITIKQWGSSNG